MVNEESLQKIPKREEEFVDPFEEFLEKQEEIKLAENQVAVDVKYFPVEEPCPESDKPEQLVFG